MFHVKHSLADGSFVSRETRQRLGAFEELLLKWNATINLISRASERAIWHRHFEDCLQLAPLIPRGTETAMDIGSGAGFPGLVLAIATGIHFDLIEADHRKASFLREAITATKANAAVHALRIENAVGIRPADLITSRALAPLAQLLVLGTPHLKQGGVALFQKGAKAEDEIAAAASGWHMAVTRYPSATDPSGVILKLSGITRVVN